MGAIDNEEHTEVHGADFKFRCMHRSSHDVIKVLDQETLARRFWAVRSRGAPNKLQVVLEAAANVSPVSRPTWLLGALARSQKY